MQGGGWGLLCIGPAFDVTAPHEGGPPQLMGTFSKSLQNALIKMLNLHKEETTVAPGSLGTGFFAGPVKRCTGQAILVAGSNRSLSDGSAGTIRDSALKMHLSARRGKALA